MSDFYRVYIACLDKGEDGLLTKDYILAKQLYRRLEQNNIHTFLMGRCDPDDRTEAIDSAEVLIVAGTSAETLMSETVRRDYEDFIAAVELSGKRKWRVFNYLRGIGPGGLPGYLTAHRSYDAADTDRLVEKIADVLSKEPARNCVSDADDPHSSGEPEGFPEALPDSVGEIRIDDDDADFEDFRRPGRARRAPQYAADEMRMEEAEESGGEEPSVAGPPFPMPPAPGRPLSAQDEKPKTVRPAKINKVDFSVVAPDEVKPGKSSVIDLLMYTRSQRSIVKRTIQQAKEKSSEAARSSGSVSVRQGSSVTAELFSDDIAITDGSQTLVWNGDALDFRFRVQPPEDYRGREIDFGCSILFDGIPISRLYFTVPVNRAVKAAVRFVRKDCRKAFVSYSHIDKPRVVEQLMAIQSVAPRLRFWMDTQSMTAGDVWRSSIASAIRGADVFLLFWSVNSSGSDEVRKEWKYALELEKESRSKRKHGARFLSPVPLDSPSVCPPPEELADLHFGDPSFDSDIADIDKVKIWSTGKPGNIRSI